ncbi:MAG: right-handed parallel beta-helix repeat-containing protein, partial [Planctomycetaceae bacterium]|nr:right-handed parallel beta-helix repeat-containing protein [Planctomycetaceae bacterium]
MSHLRSGWLKKSLSPSNRRQRTRRAEAMTRRRRLLLESLEERRVLAVLWVDNTPAAGGTEFTATGGSQPASVPGLTPGVNIFSTISAAVAAASPSDTINISDGTYSELVTVNKSVALRGNQFGVDARTRGVVPESVVNGAVINAPFRTTAFYITANSATIDGFTARDQTDVNVFNAGIVMSNTTSGVTVRNNIVANNMIGIFAGSSGPSLIERNLIDGNNTSGPAGGAGIYTENTSGLTIDDNEFRNHNINNPIIFAAVGIGAHTNLTVSDNFIHNNISGIYALGITGGLFQGNTITTLGTATALTFGGGDTAIDVLNNDLSGNLRGLRIADFGDLNPFGGPFLNSDIEAHFNNFANNTTYGAGISNEGLGLPDSYTGPLDLTCNWWGDITGPSSAANPGGGGSVVRNDFADAIDFQPWLVYSPDANPAVAGIQVAASFSVPAQLAGFTSTNNNYRRLVNAFDCLVSGQTMTLSGNFNWTEANAAASWALGNDGAVSAADNYSLLVKPNVNNVTVTAASLGSAQITGPGDLAAQNLEGFLVFDGGDNQNWTISNLEILDFDLGIGMFNGAGGSDAYSGTHIVGNRIRIPADLNATVAPADVNQNIGIHYSFGANQVIQNNELQIAGNGVSDSGGGNPSVSVGMQSNTSGGNVYDGLLISGNTLTVTSAQSIDPAVILGIWENGHAHSSNITVSNNQFLNTGVGNNPALNLQRAFRVTSHSSPATTVTYSGNTVSGANIGFEWLASTNFAGNQAVRLWQNTLTGNNTGVLVQSNGSANLFQNTITGSGVGGGVRVITGSLTGSGAVTNAVQENFISGGAGDGIRIDATAGAIGAVFDNDLSGNTGFGLNNLSAPAINAECNWWGSNVAAAVAAETSGSVDFDPWLAVGTDTSATAGFQGLLSLKTTGATTTVTGTAGNDVFLVKRNGSNTEISLNSVIISVIPTASLGNLTIDSGDGDDQLTVDYSGGIPVPNGVLTFNGGVGGADSDSLRVTGGSFALVTHTFTTVGPEHTGNLVYNDGVNPPSTISYTGLEPVDMTGSTIADLVFNLPGTADQAILEDDGTAANGISQIRSQNGAPTFETTTFANPTGSLTVNMGGDSGVLTVASLPDFNVSLVINGQAGADNVNFTGPVALSSAGADLSVTVGGAVTDSAGTSLQVVDNATFNAASITLGDNVGDAINFASLTTNTSASGGAQSITETNGIAGLNLNAGVGDITLFTGGALTDADGAVDFVADDLFLQAASGITVGTNVNNLSAAVTAAGAINITEANAVTLTSV